MTHNPHPLPRRRFLAGATALVGSSALGLPAAAQSRAPPARIRPCPPRPSETITQPVAPDAACGLS